MIKEKKQLLWASILMIIYLILNIVYMVLKNQLITDNMKDNISNVIILILLVVGIIYFMIMALKKDIDVNKHSKGILFWSIIFFIYNLVSGIIGFILWSNLNKDEKIKKIRELPTIEYKDYSNKYISLFGLVLCLFLLFYISGFASNIIHMILIYLAILLIMIVIFRKQLVHDFKYFKEYFKEYIFLAFKTWLKSLLVIMILSLIIQLITDTTNSNNQQNLQNMFNTAPIVIALLTTIYAPVAEELMFRGVIRKFIKNKNLYIIISGVLFGLMHVIDDSKTLAEFSYVIVYSTLGFYLASLYYKTNNIFTNISFHFMQNALGVIGMLLLKFM